MHVSTPLPSAMTKVCIHLSLFHLEESDTDLGECLGLLVKVQRCSSGNWEKPFSSWVCRHLSQDAELEEEGAKLWAFWGSFLLLRVNPRPFLCCFQRNVTQKMVSVLFGRAGGWPRGQLPANLPLF